MTNTDSHKHVKLTFRDVDHAEAARGNARTVDSDAGTLAPGESKDVWIHAMRSILAEEAAPAATGAPAPQEG